MSRATLRALRRRAVAAQYERAALEALRQGADVRTVAVLVRKAAKAAKGAR